MAIRRAKPERAAQYEDKYFQELAARLAVVVRRLRLERGWSQEEAAHQTGMGTRLFQAIEGARTNVTLTTLARLSRGFDVDAPLLFGSADDASDFERRERGRPARTE